MRAASKRYRVFICIPLVFTVIKGFPEPLSGKKKNSATYKILLARRGYFFFYAQKIRARKTGSESRYISRDFSMRFSWMLLDRTWNSYGNQVAKIVTQHFDGRGSSSEHKRGESERFYFLEATIREIHPFKRLSISVGRTLILHVSTRRPPP